MGVCNWRRSGVALKPKTWRMDCGCVMFAIPGDHTLASRVPPAWTKLRMISCSTSESGHEFHTSIIKRSTPLSRLLHSASMVTYSVEKCFARSVLADSKRGDVPKLKFPCTPVPLLVPQHPIFNASLVRIQMQVHQFVRSPWSPCTLGARVRRNRFRQRAQLCMRNFVTYVRLQASKTLIFSFSGEIHAADTRKSDRQSASHCR